MQRFRRFLSTIRESGGSFGQRGKGSEEKFIYEHEQQVLADLRRKLKEQAKKVEEASKKVEAAEKNPLNPVDMGATGSARSGIFAGRESASEAKYIRDHDKEHLSHLKDDLKNKK